MAVRAVFNGVVLAETPRTVRVEGNHYFPPDSLHAEYFTKSRLKTLCPWKGLASSYTITVGDQIGPWQRGTTLIPARWHSKIKNHVAFGPEVQIEGEREPRPKSTHLSHAGTPSQLKMLLHPASASSIGSRTWPTTLWPSSTRSAGPRPTSSACPRAG